ncbi:MAG: hypothetical protein WCD16_02695 [Paracoccaceae bacterium]
MDDAVAMLQKVKPQIMALDGMKHFINVMDDDGNGYVISLVESAETSEANRKQVDAIWANFNSFLAQSPEPGGFRVLMDETKG